MPAINPGLPYSGGGTNTAAALDLLRTAGQTGGALELRPGYVPIAIVVTDGQSNDEQATLFAASALHASNICEQVYAVGVSGADATELYAIASDTSLVFFTSNFNSTELTELPKNVTKELCSINITSEQIIIVCLHGYIIHIYFVQMQLLPLLETHTLWFHYSLMKYCATPYKDILDWLST